MKPNDLLDDNWLEETATKIRQFINDLESAECDVRGDSRWSSTKSSFVAFISRSLDIAQQGFESIISEGKDED